MIEQSLILELIHNQKFQSITIPLINKIFNLYIKNREIMIKHSKRHLSLTIIWKI